MIVGGAAVVPLLIVALSHQCLAVQECFVVVVVNWNPSLQEDWWVVVVWSWFEYPPPSGANRASHYYYYQYHCDYDIHS